jgi:hypothetical protein
MTINHSQVREVINRNIVISLALEQGFNAFLPVYDGGVDFILYRESDRELRKVQLKSRWTINQKYMNRQIWVAFPIASDWYLMPHDEMYKAGEADGVTLTSSWIDNGAYSRPRLSAASINQGAQYKFARIAEVAAKAADEETE